MGTNLISTLSWKYSLATGGNSNMMGIRKTLKVNNEDLLTVFYDKLQRRQVLYALTSSSNGGKEQLLEVRYDSLSRPIKFQAAAFDSLEQSYDIFGNLEKWTFGPDLQESYAYDQAGRLTGIANGNATAMTYAYPDEFNVLPNKITIGNYKNPKVFISYLTLLTVFLLQMMVFTAFFTRPVALPKSKLPEVISTLLVKKPVSAF